MVDDFEYVSVADVLTIHEVIVESNAETEPGVSSRGDIEYAVEYVESGHFGQQPETLHEKGYQLMRLLVANHPFVDGNKRTALASVVTLYALNGYDLEYGPTVRDILKRLGTDESSVESSDVVTYLRENTTTLPTEYTDTYDWLSLFALDSSQRNDYDED